MAKSNKSPPSKQKSLFSFFAKKAPTPAKTPATAPSASSTSSSSGNAKPAATSNSTNATSTTNAQQQSSSSSATPTRKSTKKALPSQQAKLLSKLTIGTKLAVFWPDDSEFYPCVIHAHRPNGQAVDAGQHPGHMYTLNYEDGEVETVDLSTEKFRIIGGKKRASDDGADAAGSKSNAAANDTNNNDSSSKKRRRIMEESEDDEMESSEEEGDDSGSEYKTAGMDDDDESLDAEESAKGVSEDDTLFDSDDEEIPKKRKVPKKVTITRVGGSGCSTVSPTPMKTSNANATTKKSVATEMDFSSFSVANNSSSKPAAATTPARRPRVSLSPMPNKPKPSAAPKNPYASKPQPAPPKATIPKPIKDQVNTAGSHMHNHLKFFTTHRRDANRRPSTHADYSPRTLSVDYTELAKNAGTGKVTPAQKQWWDIKAEYADTVLMFKTGKFYEMYHDDADVGASILDFVYMKGTMAHGGFPEAAYGTQLRKLVDAGYKVARVEQTETPAAMNERKKAMGKGQVKPQVVSREVCGIVSKGTRTFCYLEDVYMLEKGEVDTGPLVVIKEILVESDDDAMNEDGEDTGTKAMYEYGVTIVDAVTGVVTLGQFADDVLRSRMLTLLASFGPSEVLYEGGKNGASKTLLPFLKSACPTTIVEPILPHERFPKSTAVNPADRQKLDRVNSDVQPWNGDEALRELHRRGYYPRSSRRSKGVDVDPSAGEGIGRWPEILKRCVEGGATLAISSFGAALFYLQRSLVDAEILSMGIVKAYAPPSMEAAGSSSNNADATSNPSSQLQDMYAKEARIEDGMDLVEQEQQQKQPAGINLAAPAVDDLAAYAAEASIDHMALDGATLSNLEILRNITSGSYQGSLLSKIDATQSPHGSRLLRAWLLRPLFRKADIDRRADVVEELAGGSAAVAMAGARVLLKKTGDIERLLSRVHSMGGGGHQEERGGNDGAAYHPNERAVLYETDKHTKRKVGDFSKLLHGLRAASEIPELFENADIHSPMLAKIVRTTDSGGCFPADMKEKLDWFFDNFDLEQAAKGQFEPTRGMDERYDEACDVIEEVQRGLEAYKEEMCSNSELMPRHTARSAWKYVNTKDDSKDKYLIELPVSVSVPDDFQVKAKRGKGAKQVNKYRTPEVEQMVQELERAIDIKKEGKADGMKLVFNRFDKLRTVWMAATHATAMLDALGSLAQIAVEPGFSRPLIMDCPPSAKPGVAIIQGRHPCVKSTHSGADFIPNDLILGGKFESTEDEFADDAHDDSSVLLLSGPNMGGKSTLLRQTCLISILAQIGSYVPAEKCALTPVDRIFTRLGASDRILCGQSTFFVELAETAAAVRGATRRSLVIMDELGRGTSTFDGTAIASATVKHLVETNKCLTLFATHYHSLLEDWKDEPSIKLGHMECIVEEDDDEADSEKKNNITFLYTLGDGPCPKSFGVNVARLAGLPDDVLQRAKRVSTLFEAEMNGETTNNQHKIIPSTAEKSVVGISKLFSGNAVNGIELNRLW
eukprot:CAMPEP_0201877944 /NCGR_PEP_ID=MMETSP0902-20130614/9223_1 /ASSEMBLY_ACC=CAM_ASM_000551 /TAXON_ID=420261 /ORGANISM="Thalassiosira antarctica, Strain CCMP982" /LENGTH=1501 /DNA_ID=CAMNT_0048405489 /DNA_START=26 /DNA_END=4528 /DNA_ORIENTATION=+